MLNKRWAFAVVAIKAVKAYLPDANFIAATAMDAPTMIFQKSALFLLALCRRIGNFSLLSASRKVAPTKRIAGSPRASSSSIAFWQLFSLCSAIGV